jgi:ATP-dependent helicase HrpB
MSFPALPILDCLPALQAALAEKSNAILVAPPGAGKTSIVPLALLNAPWLGGDRIVMLEPRRLAARAAASRMSMLIGEQPGQTVGFRTRLDSAVSAATRIEVITEGLLVRRLQGDPGLGGVACVIFDEVHERGLDADLALALCLDLQRGLRPELRLIAMSATADGARLSSLLDAPVIESAGRLFPVLVHHAHRDLSRASDLPEAMGRAIRAALQAHPGDILAFLPGMAEIRRTEQAVSGCGAAILPLHGDLPAAEQDRALRPGDGRRVVLSTSIAETSLTVPGVRIVIDGGYRRTPRLDPATGLTRLETFRISRAAADQRAGRAGREGPGVAIRLWTPALHRGLAPFDRPAIFDSELAGLALDCAAWGASPSALPFPDDPPSGALAAARELLRSLGALTGEGLITDNGRRMAQLGAHPRLAAMMLSAATPAESSLAAELAAILEERDCLKTMDADIRLRVSALAFGDAAADRGVLSRIRQSAGQYKRRLSTRAEADGDAGALLVAAFPDRIAQRRGEPGSFRLSGGGGARLGQADKLAQAPLLVVASLDQKASSQIRLAAPLNPSQLPQPLLAQISETVESGYDAATGSVYSRRKRRYGALVLDDRIVPADPDEVARILACQFAADPDQLPWSDAARQLQARAAWLAAIEPGWADLSDTGIAARAEELIAPNLAGVSRLSEAKGRLDMVQILRTMLGWNAAARLDRELPTHLDLPGGRAMIDYCEPVPTASARAQIFYGLRETPSLVGGRIKLQLVLLSPALRPIAITGDIARFWQGAWTDVRKDMRGRYPRHNWPANPALGP